MRRLLGSIAALIAVTTPVAANQCYWVGNVPYCDPGCHISQRWWDGSGEWMEWSCGPPPEVVLLATTAAVVILIAIIAGISNAHNSHQSYTAATQQTDRDTAANKQIAQEIEDTMRMADAHIAAMIAKYEGDRHG